ncbi:MAG: phosphoglycerate dehydrogenase [Candidatus Ancaeobacter aquaticus]|nr:phosphoglycerate dehydrogenase [Candidatus Ancaeobacter aquaticus]
MKILVSLTSFCEYDMSPYEMLVNAGYDVVQNHFKRKLINTEIIKLGHDVVGIIAGTEKLDKDVIGRLNNLKVISRCGVGLDNVDISAANNRGIKVLNTPHGPTNAVAELTVGLIFGLLRQIPQMDRLIRVGKWEKRMGSQVKGKNIGIVGYGRIGQKVGELLHGFGAEIAYCDNVVNNHPIGTQLCLPEICSWSDILCLHLSPSSTNMPIIGKNELSLMKKGTWIVNCSRGGVIDEAVLYDMLKNNDLAGAALDVFKDEPYYGSLTELDNVILTPHIGSYARESRIEMEINAVCNLINALKDIKR